MGEVDAIADTAMGSMLSNAVEPEAGQAPDGRTHEGACLNCGCALTGDYCHCCGQRAHVHRTVGAFFHDLAHSILHFEGKIWHTLPLLAWQPGQLTRRYIAGERARFVSPLALFLFSVFLMFATLSMVGGPLDVGNGGYESSLNEIGSEAAAEKTKAEQEISRLSSELANARTRGAPTAEIEGRLRAARTENEVRQRVAATAQRVASGEEAGEKNINIMSEIGWKPLDQAVAKAERNPSLLLYKLQTNAYKFSWALIPISLPFLWVLFLHRKRYRREFGAYDHLVFITYSIAFMSIGAIALSLLRPLGVGDGIVGTAIAIVPALHMYRQLRGAYQLSRFSALWRTFMLLVFTSLTITIFLILLTVLGVFG